MHGKDKGYPEPEQQQNPAGTSVVRCRLLGKERLPKPLIDPSRHLIPRFAALQHGCYARPNSFFASAYTLVNLTL
ncbi:hypothetical protein GCM10022211_15090 [Sphingomonas humi]|uniref:Uncharacterized protein n=1 Tax=Sphingomonas humi TaxID=335630 RepID=A0ABP7RYK3_9SPHN